MSKSTEKMVLEESSMEAILALFRLDEMYGEGGESAALYHRLENVFSVQKVRAHNLTRARGEASTARSHLPVPHFRHRLPSLLETQNRLEVHKKELFQQFLKFVS